MRHIPLSSLSVSTISAACTCYDNRNGHHSINTLLMTAFEKKLAIYSFSMEDLRTSSPHTSSKIGSAQVSNTMKINLNKNMNEYEDDYDDGKYLRDACDRNFSNVESQSQVEVEVDSEVIYDSMKVSEKIESKSRGKWLFPPPTSSTSFPLKDSDHESHRDEEGLLPNRKKSVKNDSSDNDDSDDDDDCNDDNDNDKKVNEINKNRNPLQKKIKKSLYSDLTIPLSLFLVEGMFFDDMGKRGLNYESNKNRSDEDNSSRNSNSDKVIVSPLFPKIITKNNKNNQSNGRNQSTSAVATMRCKERGSWEDPVKDSMGRLIDQPITFRSNLRSSGYGQQIIDKKVDRSARRMSNPNIGSTAVLNSKIGNISNNDKNSTDKNKSKPITTGGPRLRLYPNDCHPTTRYQSQNDFPVPLKGGPSPPPIYDIAYRYFTYNPFTSLPIFIWIFVDFLLNLLIEENFSSLICYVN